MPNCYSAQAYLLELGAPAIARYLMGATFRISIFLILLVAVYIGFGGIMHWQLSRIASLVDAIYEHPLAVTRGALSLRRDAVAIERNLKDMLLVKDHHARQERIEKNEFYQKNIGLYMILVKDRILGAEGRKLAEELNKLLEIQSALTKEFTEAILAGDETRAFQIDKDQGRNLTGKLHNAANKLVDYAAKKSTDFRIESISILSKARVILFAAGFIIVILSLSFATLLGSWLLSSLRKTQQEIDSIAKKPMDISAPLNKYSIGNINFAVNKLLKMVSDQLIKPANNISKFDDDSKQMYDFFKGLPYEINNLLSTLDISRKQMLALMNNCTENQRYLTIFDQFFKQAKEEVLVIQQYAKSQESIIKKLKETGANSLEAQSLYNQLEFIHTVVNENCKQSARSIEVILNLANHFEKQLFKVSIIASEQREMIAALDKIREPIKIYDKKLSELKPIINDFQESFRKFKLS